MSVQEVLFGEWLPDAPDYANPGLVAAENVYHSPKGYVPMPGPNPQSLTTTEPVTQARTYFDTSGSAVYVAGSSTRLSVTKGGAVTEATGFNATDAWRFERFNDLIIAVSLENDTQYLDGIDTDTTWSALPGSPPRASQIAKVNDFIVMGDLVDTVAAGAPTVPYRIRWSAFNNPTTAWADDRGNLTGFRDLDRRYGRITGIVGGRFGLVFQERAIWRLIFVGAPKVWELQEVAIDRGCIAPDSVVPLGFQTFFLSQDGFQLTDGADVRGVGDQKINDWFSENANGARVSLTQGAINWPNRSIVWAFSPSGVSNLSRILAYNFVTNRWTAGAVNVSALCRSTVDAQTLGSLGVTFPSGLGTMSDFTLGAQEWKAQGLSFAAYVPSGNGSDFATMNANNLAAEIVTGDASLLPGYRSEVSGVWPIIEAQMSGVMTSVRSKGFEGGAISTTAPTVRGVDGFCPHKADNWLHSVRMTIPANSAWNNAMGVRVRVKKTGRR